MPTTLEERVAYLEGKVEEHSYAWQDLRERITHMEQTFSQRFISLEQRIDNRFEAIDRRFEAIDNRFEAIDQKFSKYFLWIIGIQVSVLLAVIAVMLRGVP
jgi:predicted  nucleic acid-binding Zn-ribbon protein